MSLIINIIKTLIRNNNSSLLRPIIGKMGINSSNRYPNSNVKGKY